MKVNLFAGSRRLAFLVTAVVATFIGFTAHNTQPLVKLHYLAEPDGRTVSHVNECTPIQSTQMDFITMENGAQALITSCYNKAWSYAPKVIEYPLMPWEKYALIDKPRADVLMPDGTLIKNVPAGTTRAEITRRIGVNEATNQNYEVTSLGGNKYRVVTPTGQKYEITTPDLSSENQIINYMRANIVSELISELLSNPATKASAQELYDGKKRELYYSAMINILLLFFGSFLITYAIGWVVRGFFNIPARSDFKNTSS